MVAVLGEDQHSPKYVQTQASQSEVSHLKNNKNLPFTIQREGPPLSKTSNMKQRPYYLKL